MSIKPVKSVMQVDSMDNGLRNRLWDALCINYWKEVKQERFDDSFYYNIPETIHLLITRLWHAYFKRPMDKMPYDWADIYTEIREYFFKCEWNDIYDFIEFIAKSYPDKNINLQFITFCNSVLREELSAYMFVGEKIAPITSETEIAEIEKALNIPDSLKPVKIHLKTALDLLANRTSPDYRNSIKESISAVEALCKLIAKNDKATLTLAIETIGKGKKMKMHPALGRAFIDLYSYTNTAEGIRHGLSDEPSLDLEDAAFMLVSCSAFINYLIVKASKAGIIL